MIDLCKIKEDFSGLVKDAQPWTLTQFVMWLDLKLSEFKIKGYMVLDHHSKTKPQWIAAEDSTSEVAPTPAPCRQCNKHSNDGNYYMDIHASPSTNRNDARQSQQPITMDESEQVRGEVGIIDLSQSEINRRGNASVGFRQERNVLHQNSFKNSSNVAHERDKSRKEDVIEIDSPTEKMFMTTAVSKTSTPLHTRHVPKTKHKPVPVGNIIYTSTQSLTTPTFSTGHMSSRSISSQSSTTPTFSTGHMSSRSISSQSSTTPTFSTGHMSAISRSIPSTFTNRSFALGAPPSIASTQGSLPSNLDEMIAQAVKFNEIQTESGPGSSQQLSRIDSHSVQKHSSSRQDTEQISSQISYSENKFPQTSPSKTAVPVALHANIDNINREVTHSHSSSDTMEIKIEAEVDSNITDSFFSEDNSGISHLSTLAESVGTTPSLIQPRLQSSDYNTAELPKQGLVNPDTAIAFKMVELVNGSGVYVYERTVSQAFKVGTESQPGSYNGEKMARYLLNVFWSRKELVGATLSKAGRGKKILNQQIIEAILDFSTNNGRHTRSKVYKALSDNLCTRSWRAKKILQAKLQMLEKSGKSLWNIDQ